MEFFRALTELAASVANLHPDHRSRFHSLAGGQHPSAGAESAAGHDDTPEEAVSSRHVGNRGSWPLKQA
jgi:hypothetical protein